jgi:hypothetical protein
MWISVPWLEEALRAQIRHQLRPFSPHCSGVARIPRGIWDMMSAQWSLHALKFELICSYTNKLLCVASLNRPKTTIFNLFTMSAEGASASVRWSQVAPQLRFTNAQSYHEEIPRK